MNNSQQLNCVELLLNIHCGNIPVASKFVLHSHLQEV